MGTKSWKLLGFWCEEGDSNGLPAIQETFRFIDKSRLSQKKLTKAVSIGLVAEMQDSGAVDAPVMHGCAP